ncbi:hypothetical protein ASPCADRAFT_3058 [Aspergillus carbonarius ITEM 5010]|uniref:AAA+ ATPase domain-containing protein n=1 Tax=Aspergillus carbonarius (strain ITEM 5010) TaxID=602072 RepID=A0A1R3RU25_ASPC5|nr:hypothetical protein ASPCADRAFT_3058 [Aspergillus carbonarius ITEM 5010]
MSDNESSLMYHRSAASSSSNLSVMSVDPDYTPEFNPWNKSIPDRPATDVEAGSYAQEFALIVRREPHPITHQVALHSITIQSPLIKIVLERTFKGFEGLNTQLKDLTFKAPFHLLYEADICIDRSLTPRQRLSCNYVIRGYCLSFKTCAEFYVDNISPIRWSENAFPRLVLPNEYKEIIRAFVQEQLARDDKFDDIVYGKGLGFILLLAGEPGVGKTLTAESVAEEMRQPLYLMSASELGETAPEVEESLEQVLELTSKWNAILLLDECDMFLEARSTADLRRNRLVSVFLRQLEYYRGMMFLTSNRVSDFDPAFESRIHLTIHYPALDVGSRLHVWKVFTQMSELESGLSDTALESGED